MVLRRKIVSLEYWNKKHCWEKKKLEIVLVWTLKIHCFGCSPADFFILQNPLREAQWQDRGHSALGKRDRAGNPALCGSCWEILQSYLNSFPVLQTLQSGILTCAKGKQKEKQPNPTTPTPPYYNKNGPVTSHTNTWGHPCQWAEPRLAFHFML